MDGVLVEKTNMGFEESILASILIGALTEFLRRSDLGRVVGEQGAFRLQPGLSERTESFCTFRLGIG